MHTNRYQNYIEEELLTADPVRLIQLLYRGTLDSITSARRYLKLGDIRARSRAISKAMTIVTELSLSLNHTAGGELSKNLAEVYALYADAADSGQCEAIGPTPRGSRAPLIHLAGRLAAT
jgi:flagellar biosynthetic protein FliS